MGSGKIIDKMKEERPN
jgi:hypothetical protein